MRRGTSWTAAYHLQLTVAAVARPVRSSVVPLVVRAAERSWLETAQPASARRSRQRASSVRRCRRVNTARTPPGRRSPVSGMRRPPIRLRRPGPGCPAGWCPARPVSGHLSSSGVRRSGRLLSTRPVSSHLLSAPSVRSHPSPPTSGDGVGTRSRRPGNPHHSNGRGPCGCRPVGRLGRRPRSPRAGDAAEVARWSVGVSVADPGRVGAGGGGRRAERPVAGGGAVGRGAGPGASWPHRPRGCRPRAGGRPRWVVVVAAARQGGHPLGCWRGMRMRPQRGPGWQRAFPAGLPAALRPAGMGGGPART